MKSDEKSGLLKKIATILGGLTALVTAFIVLDQALASFDPGKSFISRMFKPKASASVSTAAVGRAMEQPVQPRSALQDPRPSQPSPAPRRDIRIFLHIPTDAPLALEASYAISRKIRGLDLAGLSVATPPVRQVESLPDRIELRCLKRIDCTDGDRVAAALETLFGQSVAVRDMAGQFEGDTKIRTGNYELWLPQDKAREIELQF